MRTNGKYVYFYALMFALVVFAGAFFGEIGLRMAGKGPFKPAAIQHLETWAEPDDQLGWRNRPGEWKADVEKRPMTILHDHTRKTAFQPQGPGEIVLIGGSYTQGFGVRDEQTFASKIQKQFPSQKVINLGVGAYGTYQSLMALRRYLKNHKPPKLVIYGLLPHHIRRNVGPFSWARVLAAFGTMATDPPRVSLDKHNNLRYHPCVMYEPWFLADKSALIFFIQTTWMQLETRHRDDQAEEVMSRLIMEIKKTCSKAGASLLVAVLDADRDESAYYKKLFNKYGISVAMCNRLKQIQAENPAKRFFLKGPGGWGHPNENVHAYWGCCIAKRVQALMNSSSRIENEVE